MYRHGYGKDSSPTQSGSQTSFTKEQVGGGDLPEDAMMLTESAGGQAGAQDLGKPGLVEGGRQIGVPGRESRRIVEDQQCRKQAKQNSRDRSGVEEESSRTPRPDRSDTGRV